MSLRIIRGLRILLRSIEKIDSVLSSYSNGVGLGL